MDDDSVSGLIDIEEAGFIPKHPGLCMGLALEVKNMTLRQFSEVTNIPLSQVREVFAGVSVPSGYFIQQSALVFGEDTVYFPKMADYFVDFFVRKAGSLPLEPAL